jgi:hypothetical protein
MANHPDNQPDAKCHTKSAEIRVHPSHKNPNQNTDRTRIQPMPVFQPHGKIGPPASRV